MTRVYLDHNASAPLRPEAAEAMTSAMALRGNPSSVHGEGRQMRAVVERARIDVAELAGCDPASVVFTSGATEANAMAMKASAGPVAAAGIEHPSILENIGDLRAIACLPEGRIDLAALESLLDEDRDIAAVALMAANNETGVVQPVAEAAGLCRAAGVRLHVDAVQQAGKDGLADIWAHCDSMSVTAHKIGGPTGSGALIVRDPGAWPALIAGGGQEQRVRAGTENVSGIAGFGAAARSAALEADGWAEVRDRRDRLEAAMRARAPELRIVGGGAPRLPNTLCAAVPGIPSDLMTMRLDLAGIAVSAGSACSSGKVARSHVLEAMGLDDEVAGSAIRVSFGWATERGELDLLLEAWSELHARTHNLRWAGAPSAA